MGEAEEAHLRGDLEAVRRRNKGLEDRNADLEEAVGGWPVRRP